LINFHLIQGADTISGKLIARPGQAGRVVSLQIPLGLPAEAHSLLNVVLHD
jgi:hypothetical protein